MWGKRLSYLVETKSWAMIRIIFILLALMIVGCEVGNADEAYFAAESSSPEYQGIDESRAMTVDGLANTQNSEPSKSLKLLKNGKLRYEVDSLHLAIASLKKEISNRGGYVSNESRSQSHYSVNTTIVARIPSAQFDNLITSIAQGVDEFDEKEITVKDVTASFYDLETRLNAKKKAEERYLEILQEAKNVEEILQVEKQLGDIRTEIESMQGRFNLLQSQVTMSSISFSMYEKCEFEVKAPDNRFVRALENGWQGIVMFLVILTNLWPVLLLLAVVVFILLRRRKRRRNQS